MDMNILLDRIHTPAERILSLAIAYSVTNF